MKWVTISNLVNTRSLTPQDYVDYKKALEARKDASMPIRAGVFFDMFPFCILYEVIYSAYILVKITIFL